MFALYVTTLNYYIFKTAFALKKLWSQLKYTPSKLLNCIYINQFTLYTS